MIMVGSIHSWEEIVTIWGIDVHVGPLVYTFLGLF